MSSYSTLSIYFLAFFIHASPCEFSQSEGIAGAKGVVRKKVTLSLRVAKLNGGVPADALTEGLALPACVKSVEDHGYTLDLGIKVCTPKKPYCSEILTLLSISHFRSCS